MYSSMPGLPIHHQLPEFTQTHLHGVGNAIQPSHPLLSPSPPALSLSQHQGLFQMSQFFPSGGQSIGVSASGSVLPKNIQDWFPLGWTGWISPKVGVQGTLKSLLQHHSSKASILWRSAFFMVQLSHPYMTTGNTIALTRQTFVGKAMSLLFHMLSRLVITFLPRSKRLLISRLQSPSAVILEPKKIKSDTVSTVSPSFSHEVMGPDALIFIFWMLSFKPTFSAGYVLSFYWGPSYEPRDLTEESANKLSFISCSHVFISPQFATFGSLKLCALFCHFSIICCFCQEVM